MRGRTIQQRGQASLELLVAIPLIALAALVAWQLAAVTVAGLAATERARAAALERSDGRGVITIERRVAVARVLPLPGRLSITARAVVVRP